MIKIQGHWLFWLKSLGPATGFTTNESHTRTKDRTENNKTVACTMQTSTSSVKCSATGVSIIFDNSDMNGVFICIGCYCRMLLMYTKCVVA